MLIIFIAALAIAHLLLITITISLACLLAHSLPCSFIVLYFDSVKIMEEKLDPEKLGIITLNGFMEEFFPQNCTDPNTVTTFTLHHYNGLSRSNTENKVGVPKFICL